MGGPVRPMQPPPSSFLTNTRQRYSLLQIYSCEKQSLDLDSRWRKHRDCIQAEPASRNPPHMSSNHSPAPAIAPHHPFESCLRLSPFRPQDRQMVSSLPFSPRTFGRATWGTPLRRKVRLGGAQPSAPAPAEDAQSQASESSSTQKHSNIRQPTK